MWTLLYISTFLGLVLSFVGLMALWEDFENKDERQRAKVARLTLLTPVAIPLALPLLVLAALWGAGWVLRYLWRTAFPVRRMPPPPRRQEGPYR